jgi:hypothetical protein
MRSIYTDDHDIEDKDDGEGAERVDVDRPETDEGYLEIGQIDSALIHDRPY